MLSGLILLAQIIKRNGSAAFIQLFHAGCIPSPLKVLRGLMPLSPTARPCFLDPDFTCDEPDDAMIWDIIEDYGKAAARAQEAGFDGIDIHAGHGGLHQQFLSPLLNERTDIWGQEKEKFGLEMIKAIKKHCGDDFPIIWRISLDEMSGPGGFSAEDSLKWIPKWEAAGVHSFHVSAGGIMSVDALTYAVQPVYFPMAPLVKYAEMVKKITKLPVIGVAKLMNTKLSHQVIDSGRMDIMAVGRPASADPQFPNKVLEGRDSEIRKCIACNWCLTTHSGMNMESRCSVNASLCREGRYKLVKTDNPKRVMVIGGGVGGLETARVAHKRGHEVIVFEKAAQLGGLVRTVASKIPGLLTQNLNHAPEFLINEMERLNIPVITGVEVTAEIVKGVKPDVVIVATGSVPGDAPDLPGITNSNVINYEDYILNPDKVAKGKEVIVIGGAEGAEITVGLAKKGCRVTLVAASEAEVMDTPYLAKDGVRKLFLQQTMAEVEVQIVINTTLKEVKDGEVVVITDGAEKTVPADYVILAQPRKAYNPLGDMLRPLVKEVYEVGDCVAPRAITEAIDDGAHFGRQI
jgi:2,4-dienoyl-CoA reductase-like NADH-dependent reductase (Old Yellow Enzyme family)/thioredoxin reductase